MDTAISDNLIHFLARRHKESPFKQFNVFKSIIEDGLKCSNIQIKFGSGGNIFNQVVCFSDIPLSFCDEHTATYGKFGIGFKKSFVKKCGGNPVRYFVDYLPGETLDKSLVENRGQLFLNMCLHFNAALGVKNLIDNDASLYNKDGKIVFDKEALHNWYTQQIAILSFEKEMGDLGPARDETKEIDLYYKEREWRLVPMLGNLIAGTIAERDGAYFYKFRREDVNVIVTPNDEIRIAVLKYLLGLAESEDIRLKEFSEPPTIISYDDLSKW